MISELTLQPLQRISKYPLLFNDLNKSTPVIDNPEVHAEVEKALYRLRETAAEIDRAADDEYAKDRMQQSWRLQDMLVFPEFVCPRCSVRGLMFQLTDL